jgi:hypothetical protein
MSIEVQGVVFYNGLEYVFALHHNNGTIENIKYKLFNHKNKTKMIMCYTYTVIKLSEIEKEAGYVLDITKRNYQLTQQQQQLINKNTCDNLITSANNLNGNIKKFTYLYNNFSNNIIDDWAQLGIWSVDYYEKYGQGNLTDSEKEKYDKISVNMFCRFQAFNEQMLLINQLNDIIPDIDKSSQVINKLCEEIETKDNRISGNIIEAEDLNVSI